MINKETISKAVNNAIEGTGLFLIDVAFLPDEVIDVMLDSMTDITIDDCAMVNNSVREAFGDELDDWELTVGSYGISEPFKVKQQYVKNIGGEVEVLTTDGRKLKGTLSEAGDEVFAIEVPTKVKPEGKKRPELVLVKHEFNYNEVKYTKNIISIK